MLRKLRGGEPSSNVNLVKAIRRLIARLDEVDKYPALYTNRCVLRSAVHRYEHIWIPLLARAPAEQRTYLVPPLDVEWVWMVHMLCPGKYAIDSAAMWAAAHQAEPDSVVDHCVLDGKRRLTGLRAAQNLWEEHFPDEPFDILPQLAAAPLRESSEDACKMDGFSPSVITYDIPAAAERQMAFHYQVAVMPQYRSSQFLADAVIRYRGLFLELQRRHPGQIWVPTYDIDVAWHAHMMHPVVYAADTRKKCGRLLQHDDTLNDRSEGSDLSVRWEATCAQWRADFGVPLERGGGMWRGNVSFEERSLRPAIQESVSAKRQALPETLQKFSITVTNELLSEADRKNLRAVEWLHTTELRMRKLVAPKTLDPADNASRNPFVQIERFTKLGSKDESFRSFFSRTVHSLLETSPGSSTADIFSFLEIFADTANGAEGGNACHFPVASAHNTPRPGMCTSQSPNSFSSLEGEKALLLRIAGEDYAILAGKWKGFAPARRRTEYRPYNYTTGAPEVYEKPGSRGKGGFLQIKIMFLHAGFPARFSKIQRRAPAESFSQFSLRLPRSRPGSVEGARVASSEIYFDVLTGDIKVRDPADVLPAYLIVMSAAMLFVTLQPRYKPASDASSPEEKTMYPVWGIHQLDYPFLAGAGGEILTNGQLEGCGRLLDSCRESTYAADVNEIGNPTRSLPLAAACSGGVYRGIPLGSRVMLLNSTSMGHGSGIVGGDGCGGGGCGGGGCGGGGCGGGGC